MSPNSREITHVVPIERESTEEPADYEKAVSATGYGIFNYLLLLAIIPVGWATVFETTTAAFILPAAECDLELTLFRKGTLTGATYAGMISTAFIWGFFADHVGRRSLLRFGLASNAICIVFISFSPNYFVFLALKFTSGCLLSGPFAIAMTYVAEFQSEKHRAKVNMWLGLVFTLANVAIPGSAWLIIPQPWSLTLFGGRFLFNSWRIFLLISATPATLGLLTTSVFPESPKFLMTQGKCDEALKIFKRMYAMNTGKGADTFPIKTLILEKAKLETDSGSRSTLEKLKAAWAETRQLFWKPYLAPFLTIVFIEFGGMLGINTLRLWLPQLFTLLDNFDEERWDPADGMPTMCERLNFQVVHPALNRTVDGVTVETCVPLQIHKSVYMRSIVIALTSCAGFLLIGMIINKLGRKNMIIMVTLISASCFYALNWAPSDGIVLAFAAIIIMTTRLSINTVISIIIDVVPTSLRTMSVSLILMFGRMGGFIGNLVFPLLLEVGCTAAFLMLGGFITVCFILSFFLPKPSGKLI